MEGGKGTGTKMVGRRRKMVGVGGSVWESRRKDDQKVNKLVGGGISIKGNGSPDQDNQDPRLRLRPRNRTSIIAPKAWNSDCDGGGDEMKDAAGSTSLVKSNRNSCSSSSSSSSSSSRNADDHQLSRLKKTRSEPLKAQSRSPVVLRKVKSEVKPEEENEMATCDTNTNTRGSNLNSKAEEDCHSVSINHAHAMGNSNSDSYESSCKMNTKSKKQPEFDPLGINMNISHPVKINTAAATCDFEGEGEGGGGVEACHQPLGLAGLPDQDHKVTATPHQHQDDGDENNIINNNSNKNINVPDHDGVEEEGPVNNSNNNDEEIEVEVVREGDNSGSGKLINSVKEEIIPETNKATTSSSSSTSSTAQVSPSLLHKSHRQPQFIKKSTTNIHASRPKALNKLTLNASADAPSSPPNQYNSKVSDDSHPGPQAQAQTHTHGHDHGRLQGLVDLVMWRDVSRSAFVFGLGTFLIISSSYAKDLNISIISVAAYLGLVYLAAVFLYRSFQSRGVVDERVFHSPQINSMLGEDEALWLVKLLLPYLNESLLKLRGLFSGDPAVTMKLALMLFVLARCGSYITIWKMVKLGFFGVFVIPKFYLSYSAQITAYGKFWFRRFRDAWQSCSHKKIVAFFIFTFVWNFSSVVARAWAAFMLFVAFRYYQQSLGTDDWVQEQNGQYGLQQKHIGRQKRKIPCPAYQRKEKKSF